MSDELLGKGKYLDLWKRGSWEYCKRPFSDVAIGILAINDQEQVILVEQFRVPIGQSVIELPAGLVGDDLAGEDLMEAGKRELLEETGYEALAIRPILDSPTSAGMTSERTVIAFAHPVRKVSAGGGVDGENIVIHEIPLARCLDWLESKNREGVPVDFKIHAALMAARVMDKAENPNRGL